MNNQEFYKMINQEFNLSGENLEEIEAFKDYWINSGNYKKLNEKSKNIISRYYSEKIKENKEDISRQIDSEKIEQIITPVSFSFMKKSEIDELPIQKSLKVFPNIKTIILLYTDDTEKQSLNLKKTLADEYKVEIYLERIADSEISLRGLQRKYEFSKEKTVIDITLGLKITSIQLYKLAVEADINVINWMEPYKPVVNIEDKEIKFDKERTFRVSLKTSLERMMQPAIESMKKKKKLNEDLKKWNFKEALNYYSTSGNEMFEKVFEHLSQIINFNSVFTFDFDRIREKCILLVDDLIKLQLTKPAKERGEKREIKDKNSWIQDLIYLFTIVSKTDEEIADIQILGENINEKSIEESIGEDSRISAEKRLLCDIFYENADWEIRSDSGKKILKWILIELVKRNLDDEWIIDKNIINPKLASEISTKDDAEFRNYTVGVFNSMIQHAMQKIDDYTITLSKGILSIPKFNKKIDLCEYDEFKECFDKNREPRVIYTRALRELITAAEKAGFSGSLTLGEIFGVGKKSGTLAKDKTRFSSEIAAPLNSIIAEIIPIKNGEKEDLIILETNRIVLNKFYYTYE